MSAQTLNEILAALGRQFGHLDNQVEKWAALGEELAAYDSQIEEALQANFGADSTPTQIFVDAAARRTGLAADLTDRPLSAEDRVLATGYLYLRFFIYLNGFLQACVESLEKVRLNAGLDAAELVEKSYYKPYFFDRVTITTDEIITMLEADLSRLQELPQDKKGVVGAFRVRKGVVSTMVESYCPLHPWHYPFVARLDGIPTSANPAVIGEVETHLSELLSALN